MTTAEEIFKLKAPKIPYFFCIPSLLGAVTFPLYFRGLVAYPGNILELFATWWFVVVPICTIVAFIILVRATWKSQWSGRATALAWTTLVGTLLVDAFFVVVMMANSP